MGKSIHERRPSAFRLTAEWLLSFFPSISSSAHLGIPPEGSGKKFELPCSLLATSRLLYITGERDLLHGVVFLREVLKGKRQIIIPVMWKGGKELAGILSPVTIWDVFCIRLSGGVLPSGVCVRPR